MNDNINIKYSFFGLWTRIYDLTSSEDAASLGGIISGYLASSYLLVLLMYIRGTPIILTAAESDAEYNIVILVLLILTTLFTYLAHRVYLKINLTPVPYIFGWFCIEMIFSTPISSPLFFIFFKILLFTISINSLLGWLNIRKYRG